ncbi:MAG: hypothetical protein LBP87_08930 [Planctomycetaceae bacterium]|nr:hypothetical protein [Planctomycetaceae bacterium]
MVGNGAKVSNHYITTAQKRKAPAKSAMLFVFYSMFRRLKPPATLEMPFGA